jgi:phosphatidate cytidylyltransferase
MLKARVMTALVLLPIVLACLFAGIPMVWETFALVALAIGAWEWSRFASFSWFEMLVFIAGYLVAGSAWLWLPIAWAWAAPLDVFALLFWLLLAPCWLQRKWALQPKWLAALTGWLILLAALAAVTRLHALKSGPIVLLLVLAIAWIADIAAYFAGRAFGKNKLAPSISPGKTREGVYGAVLAVGIYLIALHQFGAPIFAAIPLPILLPLGIALTAVSVVGDLFESLLKRQCGMKDSSNLLPGHGGVLDRIDSLLALAPVAAALHALPFYLAALR